MKPVRYAQKVYNTETTPNQAFSNVCYSLTAGYWWWHFGNGASEDNNYIRICCVAKRFLEPDLKIILGEAYLSGELLE